MTGPEHYRKAEELLAVLATAASEHTWLEKIGSGELSAAMAAAQAHATLALAAAIVDGPAVMRPEDRNEWDAATGRMP